jgi:small-conductance mechanosensitive channel
MSLGELYADLARLPHWAFGMVLILFGAVVALPVHTLAFRLLRRLAARRGGPFLRALIQRSFGPSRLGLVILGVGAAAAAAPIPAPVQALIHQILLMAFIVLVGWLALTALHVWAVIYSRRFKLDASDNLIARKHVTQVKILERTAAAFIIVVTMAAALMTIGPVRQYGVTLLASAGAAGIIAGLALQPLLTNLIAGVQIAVTQPIRIDDAVIVENEWGWIEEIGSTYVVVRLWDWRRMVLPLSYFIQNPFQNWTRETASLIGTAMIYVDYSAPVDEMREKLKEIAQATPLWDGDVVNLAVTDLSDRTMQVRCLVSARNAGEAFDLRCLVREKMVAFLKAEHPGSLPRARLEMEAGGGEAAA